MDDRKINDILNVVYEIEGLAEMALRRDSSDAAARIIVLMEDKIRALSEMVPKESAMPDAADCTLLEDAAEYSDDLSFAPDVEDDRDLESVELSASTYEVKPEPEPKAEVRTDSEDELDRDDYSSYTLPTQSVEIDDHDEDDDDEDYSFEDDDDTALDVPTQGCKPDLSVFSINDKFRFKRELFGGNMADYNASLRLIAEMHSMRQAEEYFFGDLQWNPESPEVTLFMERLEEAFSKGGK